MRTRPYFKFKLTLSYSYNTVPYSCFSLSPAVKYVVTNSLSWFRYLRVWDQGYAGFLSSLYCQQRREAPFEGYSEHSEEGDGERGFCPSALLGSHLDGVLPPVGLPA